MTKKKYLKFVLYNHLPANSRAVAQAARYVSGAAGGARGEGARARVRGARGWRAGRRVRAGTHPLPALVTTPLLRCSPLAPPTTKKPVINIHA